MGILWSVGFDKLHSLYRRVLVWPWGLDGVVTYTADFTGLIPKPTSLDLQCATNWAEETLAEFC